MDYYEDFIHFLQNFHHGMFDENDYTGLSSNPSIMKCVQIYFLVIIY